jgi:DNA-binding beta-propeller fold protein YncE
MGKFAYVTDYSDVVVSMFKIDSSTGVLHSTGTVFEGAIRNTIVVDPSGSFAYVGTGNDTLLYSIDHSTGSLSLLGSAGSGTAGPLTFDPSGKFAYTLTPGNVLTFKVNTRTGVLSPAGHVSGPNLGNGFPGVMTVVGTTQ